jgi:hypothetical protein
VKLRGELEGCGGVIAGLGKDVVGRDGVIKKMGAELERVEGLRREMAEKLEGSEKACRAAENDMAKLELSKND